MSRHPNNYFAHFIGNRSQARGFTLIELLVVIAIIAILAVVVILTLNPAEMLKQARDSNRVSDLSTLKTGVALFLADGQTATSAANTCYTSQTSTTANCGGRFTSGTFSTSATTTRFVDGTGWLYGVNFNNISSKAPMSQLPIDPLNDGTYFYAYATTSTKNGFELNAALESSKYGYLEDKDGGSSPTIYEIGSTGGL